MLESSTAAQAIKAQHLGPEVTFTGVTTDSRAVRAGDLFVALRGERFDGHSFVDSAFEAGATAALIDDPSAVKRRNVPLLVASDTRLALGELSAYWRKRFDIPLVAVTGSNGKTTVKDMLAGILRIASSPEAVLATAGNLNNDIGMPLTLLRLRESHRYAVIEMGMNHEGEIRYLTQLARPTAALVNNAGVAHIGELGSREAIANAKGEIYEGLGGDGIALINADDDFAELWRAANRSRKVIDFGIERPASITARYSLRPEDSSIKLRTPGEELSIRLQVPGLHNVRNALAAAAAAYAVGVSPSAIATGLAAHTGTKGRLQRSVGRHGALIIDDTYNANPDSVKAAIAVLAAGAGKRVLVLGDMGELGEAASTLHGEVGTQARMAGIEHLFTLGSFSHAAAQSFGAGAQHFQDIDALCQALDSLLDADTVVLIKGSRFMRMERVVQRLADGKTQVEGEH
jgi:UDP-N-acetylmuramoyl-tripeptide--D-alanyl-D-alanine ligase